MRILKLFLSAAAYLLISQETFAQLSGTITVPNAIYPNLSAVITDLNTVGVGAGGVVINLTTGNPQTAPAGGYQMGSAVLNASVSATNTITLNGSGNTITANTGTSTTVDGIFMIKGTDYVTINNLNLTENAANITATTAMEWGYALVNLNGTAPLDGCQFDVIQNCTITLNRAIATPSKGIYMSHTTALSSAALAPTATADLHSNNKFYGNTISNCVYGIYVLGFNDVTPFALYDQNNDFGGTSAATGNNITNFAGTNYSGVAGIYSIYQNNANVSYNTINNIANGGVNAVGGVWGVYAFGTNSTFTVSNNAITLGGAGINTAYFLYGIYSNALGTNLTAQNNTISLTQGGGSAAVPLYGIFFPNGTNLTAQQNTIATSQTFANVTTTASMIGIYTTAVGAINISGNNVQESASATMAANCYAIYSAPAVAAVSETITNNRFNNFSIATSGFVILIYATNPSTSVNISGNAIGTSFTRTVSGPTYCIYNVGAPASGTSTIANNNFSNITTTGSGAIYGIYYSTTATHSHIISNDTFTNWNASGGAAQFYGIYLPSGNGNSVFNNYINNLTSTYNGACYGIYGTSGTNLAGAIYNNTVSNLTNGGAALYGLYHAAGLTGNIYNNRISNLTSGTSTSGAAYGLYSSGGNTVSAYNNMISDIKAPAASGTSPVYGMYFSGGTTVAAYHNTVNLDPVSTGTDFGATGAFYSSGITSFDFRNNIIRVNAQAAGAGSVVVLRRSTGTASVVPSNFVSTSNNNIYYAPAATNSYLYAEGSTLPLVNAFNLVNDPGFNTSCGLYKQFMAPRESAAYTENNLTQIGTTGTYAPTGSSFAKSNAAPTTSPAVTTDLNGVSRPNPADVGALQFTGTATPPPTPVITASSATTFCQGGSVVLNAPAGTGFTYQWLLGGNPIAGATGSTYTATGAGVYSLNVITGTNCTMTSNTITVTVNPLPAITITPSAATAICTGSNVALTANGGTTYNWSPATGLSATTGATVIASPTTTITYTVTGTNANGCVNTATKLVTVNPLPTVSVTPAAATAICNGSSVSLTGNGATTYSWSPATGLSATTGATVNASPTATITYTLTGTDANGCVNTATKLVTVNALPTISVNPTPAAICIGSSIALTANGAATYSWTPSSSLSAGTGTTVTASPVATTTYTITGTDINGCVNSTTKQVTVNPLPNIVVSPLTTVTTCPGNGTVLTASGALTYAWSPSASLSSPTGTTVTASPNVTTTYTVTGTDVNGCVNTATKQVTVYNLIIAVSPAGPISFCGSGSAVLTASGATSYTWSPAAGLSATTGSVVTASPAVTTTYSVTGTDLNGCTNTVTKLITVNPLPTISVTPASATAICIGSGIALTANGALSYSWAPSGSLSASTGATVTASPIATTTYTVTGTDLNGCINTATKTVTVNSLPTVTVSPATAITFCAGASAILTAGGATTYNWSPAAGLSATTGAIVTATPAVTTTYTVTGTDINGCPNTAAKLITVNPLPTVSVTPAAATAICTGSSVSLTANGALTYSWSPATGLSATTGATVIASPTSTITYTVTGTNVNGCVNTSTKLVTVNPLPTITVAPAAATTLCVGTSVVLTANGGATYAWSPAAGLSATTGTSVTATPAATTTYTITGTDANGCVNTGTKLITVNPLPTLSVTPAAAVAICNGSSVSLTANGATTYSWSPAAGLSATTGATVIASPVVTTTYTITGTNINGCVNTTTKLVTVNPLPATTVSPSPQAFVCAGNTVILTGGPVTAGFTYQWAFNTVAIPGATAANYTTGILGTYTLTVTNSTTGCLSAASTNVIVNTLPGVAITPTAAAICFGLNTTLTASGANSYIWSPAAGLSSTTTPIVTASPAGTTTYTVTGTGANGCTNTATAVVTVNPLPPVSITPAGLTYTCTGTPAVLTANGAITYTWSPAAGLSATTGQVVNATPAFTTIYAVVGTDGNGCTNTAYKALVLYPKPQSMITPSGSFAICKDDTALLQAVNPGYSAYNWQLNGVNIPGATNTNFGVTASGTYTVKVTDTAGCTSITTVPAIVTVTPHPVPVITATGAVMNAGSGFLTYQWYFNGQLLPGAIDSSYTALHEGFYTVAVTDNTSNCIGTSTAFHMVQLGVSAINLKEAIKLYPNPANTIVHIDSPVPVSIAVSSMEGKFVMYKKDAHEIDLSNWADGVYTVIITDKNGGYIKSERVIKVSR